jgi:carbon monoxide dehydrogenase subunit G
MKRTVTGLAFATMMAGPALADAGVVAVYDTTPDKLWAMVDFHKPSEAIMPPIASSERNGEGIGATKTNTLGGDGGKIELQLVYFDPEAKAFNYVIRSGPLPVSNYVGEVKVSDDGNGKAQLSWQGHYAANGVPQEKADEILGGFYEAIAGKIGETYKRLK